MNLFRVFDPLILNLPLNWVSRVLFLVFIITNFWFYNNEAFWCLKLFIHVIIKDFKNLIFNRKLLIFMRLFIFILINNFLGLFPYVFTASTHLAFGLSLGLPLWLGYITYSFKVQKEYILAHLVPLGTPVALQPFIVLIELISNIIRPLTLRVRLMANIIAGHLLLTLLGILSNGGIFLLFFVITGIMLILLLELGVAIIQAYVFTLLSGLYVREIDRIKIRKIYK